MRLRLFFVVLSAFMCVAPSYAFNIKAVLKDGSNGEVLPFATVSATPDGKTDPVAYALTDEKGSAQLVNLSAGTYVFKAELLGYKAYTKKITIKDADIDLSVIRLSIDYQQLSAAQISAKGNPIVMKQDTIEFNANTFKTTDNDVLEDLIKKIPGMEVSEDGSITHNGRSISKITIDGKTFFLDDPQLASKNIPAKIVEKVKVVEKKSDQAQFTGIDDGEEETVLDLSIKPGMMHGSFGNVMAGGGVDIPSSASAETDARFQVAGFLGNFTENQQISAIVNANNTNNRGFNDLSGSMMGNMRGGGGGMGHGQGGWGSGNGITTSYMAGVNGGWDLFDDKMELGANYLYNNTNKDVKENSTKTTYLEDGDLLYNSRGFSNTQSAGHRIGVRMDHKFSDNTSILFEPRINFGTGSFTECDTTETMTLTDIAEKLTNNTNSLSSGSNKNLSTSGFALLRQKLGIPGRTLTVMARYSYSNNELDGNNISNTTTYDDAGLGQITPINQTYNQNNNSYSLMGRATFTQPLGGNFYAEVNYAYSWNKSTSAKNTYDELNSHAFVDSYSNSIVNEYVNQEIGANFLYQQEGIRAQLGFAAKPTRTHNYTANGSYAVDTTMNTVRWAPQGMLWWEMGENASARIFYRGSSEQPSTSQLITVADNTNPLNVSFGNPSLAPYFSHSIMGDYRYNNKQTFASAFLRFDASYKQNPIVNGTWYTNGIAYSMPMNGPDNGNVNASLFVNIPIGRSNFTISNMIRGGYSQSANYVGTNINTSDYLNSDGSLQYSKFFADYDELMDHFTQNRTNTVTLNERLRVTYRSDDLEIQLSGRTRINSSKYTLNETVDKTTTFNNQVRATANWTWDLIGLTLKGEYKYNWYNGYKTAQDDEHVLDAEIQKLLFKNKLTLALKCYDILGNAKNLTVTDTANYHSEALNNTLGRYIIFSLTYRFGTFDMSKMGPHGGPGGPRGPRP